jgi:general secretion pathway protein A
MHEEYYGFSDKPFSLTPDPKYLYKSETHASAFDLLQYAIRRREGFVVVTGDIGTGKTTLCRAILEQLDRKTFTALVLNPFLSEEDLLRLILQDFGVVSREEMKRGRLAGVTKQELIDTLNEFLLSLLPLGAGALLIIDEAQNLPRQVLEQIRILSNLETNREKLLQIVLVGQLNLKELLRSPELRQLDQRVSIRYELRPLTREETAAYIAHRLTIAGGSVVSFAPKALELVHKYTGGVPRLINLLCDRALLGGYSARTQRITPEIVTAAATGLDLVATRRSIVGWVKRHAPAFAAGAALTAVLASAVTYAVTTLQARATAGKPAAHVVVQAPPAERDTTPAVTGMKGTSGPAIPVAEDSQPANDARQLRQPSPASRAPSYSILVGSFRYEPEAALLIGQLSELGYRTPSARVSSSAHGTWHQVLIGPYNELELAKQDQSRVRQLPGYADAQLVTQ